MTRLTPLLNQCRLRPTRVRPTPQIQHSSEGRPILGLFSLSTRTWGWFMYPLETPLPIIMVGNETGSIITPAQWWRCISTPAKWPGIFRLSITTFGILTCLLSPRFSIGNERVNRFLGSLKRPSKAMSFYSTERQESHSFPSWRRQSHKVLLRETSRHPRSRFRASPDPCLNCRVKMICCGG